MINEIQLIQSDQIHPNEYNPNVMTDSEFAELVTEVKHLGRLPKPVIVKPNAEGYIIIDGEHGWRAAKENGLENIPCEVVDVDNFEAMRQTYKRNQHGTHNPVLLGQMFQQMMKGRGLSQRALAKEMEVSEGTVRNALEYAKAAEVRNDYAFEKLSVKQIRLLNRLPEKIADLWLNYGVQIKDLWRVETEEDVKDKESEYGSDGILNFYNELNDSGLLDYLDSVKKTRSGFSSIICGFEKWHKYENRWYWAGGVDPKILRPYLRLHFEGCFYVRDEYMLEQALSIIMDTKDRPPEFLLTPEEFNDVITETGKESSSHEDFMQRLTLCVARKTGEKRESKWNVMQELLEIELKDAPDYIRECELSSEAKKILWKLEGTEEAKQRVIEKDNVDALARGDKYVSLEGIIKTQLINSGIFFRIRSTYENMGKEELAMGIATNVPLYDKDKDSKNISGLAKSLETLTKQELTFFAEYTNGMCYYSAVSEAIKNMAL